MIHCPTNELYGHAEIFRKYAGIEKAIPVNGRLQHGWQGVVVKDSLDRQGIKFFTWRKDVMGYNIDDQHITLDPKRTFVVGSPILYLPLDTGSKIERHGTLAIPIHSISEHRIVKESWKRYCEYLLYTYGVNTSILVHPRDVELGYDKIAKDCGLKAICCGKVFDRNCLLKLVSILRSFRRVAMNVIATATFYAIYLRTDVIIDRVKIDFEPPDVLSYMWDFDWMQKCYPDIMSGAYSRELALYELGYAHKKTPNEIRELMFDYACV